MNWPGGAVSPVYSDFTIDLCFAALVYALRMSSEAEITTDFEQSLLSGYGWSSIISSEKIELTSLPLCPGW